MLVHTHVAFNLPSRCERLIDLQLRFDLFISIISKHNSYIRLVSYLKTLKYCFFILISDAEHDKLVKKLYVMVQIRTHHYSVKNRRGTVAPIRRFLSVHINQHLWLHTTTTTQFFFMVLEFWESCDVDISQLKKNNKTFGFYVNIDNYGAAVYVFI